MAFYETILDNTCGSCKYFRWPRSKYAKGVCTYRNSEEYSDENAEICSHYWAINYSSEARYVDEDDDSSSSSGCFLTTACCEYKGLPDNCYELETLRNFRDEYLIKTKIGEQLVRLYYDNAPVIVKRLNEKNDKSEIYNEIYNKITHILGLIEKKEYETVVGKYMEMVMFAERKAGT